MAFAELFAEEKLASFLSYWCLHVSYAPYLFFGLIVLSGLNVPIGEEILVMFAGVVTAHCAPHQAYWMWGWLYAGTLLAAYITYWMGHFCGPYMQRFALFRSLSDPATLEKMNRRIHKHGWLTFIAGRFFPGGIRNALFFTAGWTRFPFKTFVLRDGCGAFLATTFFFVLGIQLSEHAAQLFHEAALVRHWLLGAALLATASVLVSWSYKHLKARR